MKEILPSYFSSEWSFASFHIQETQSIVCFGPDNTVIGTFFISIILNYFICWLLLFENKYSWFFELFLFILIYSDLFGN